MNSYSGLHTSSLNRYAIRLPDVKPFSNWGYQGWLIQIRQNPRQNPARDTELEPQEAIRIAGENPDYMIQDMFKAIERGDYPVWNVYVQLMSPEEAEKYKVNIFEMTKVWSHKGFPLLQIGRLTMNRNVSHRNRSPILSCSHCTRKAAKLLCRH